MSDDGSGGRNKRKTPSDASGAGRTSTSSSTATKNGTIMANNERDERHARRNAEPAGIVQKRRRANTLQRRIIDLTSDINEGQEDAGGNWRWRAVVACKDDPEVLRQRERAGSEAAARAATTAARSTKVARHMRGVHTSRLKAADIIRDAVVDAKAAVVVRGGDMLRRKEILVEREAESEAADVLYEIAQNKLHSEETANKKLSDVECRQSRAMAIVDRNAKVDACSLAASKRFEASFAFKKAHSKFRRAKDQLDVVLAELVPAENEEQPAEQAAIEAEQYARSRKAWAQCLAENATLLRDKLVGGARGFDGGRS